VSGVRPDLGTHRCPFERPCDALPSHEMVMRW
jgi:hypothetical protein